MLDAFLLVFEVIYPFFHDQDRSMLRPTRLLNAINSNFAATALRANADDGWH